VSRVAGPLLALALLAWPSLAAANGGTVQVSSQRAGPYEVSVYTSPSPISVGSVDVSVLVQDPGGEAVQDATVGVWVRPASEAGRGSRYPATHEQATNKLFYAANVSLDAPGSWQFVVEVEGADGSGEVSFAAEVSQPSPLDSSLVIALVVLAPVAVLTAWYLARPKRKAHGRGA